MKQILSFLWPGIPVDPSSAGAAVRVRQFVHLSRAVSTIAGVNIVNTLLTAFLFWDLIPAPVILVWAGVSLWASGNRMLAWYMHRDWPPPAQVSRRTLIRSTLWGGLGGILWGVVGFGMAWQGSIVHHVFLAFVIGGQAAAAAVWMSSILTSSYAYIWLSVGPLGVGLFLRDDPLTTFMAFMVLFFMLASFQLARRTHDDFSANIKANLDLENLNKRLIESEQRYRSSEETLTTAIEAMDAGFVLFDPQDRLVMANAKYRKFYGDSAPFIKPGTKFEDLLRHDSMVRLDVSQFDDIEKWITNRLAEHAMDFSNSEQLMEDGLWLQVSERRTSDGSSVGFRFDITKLKQAQDDLRRARDEAEAASNAKSEFLSSMSHELRTPLNAVLGFAQLLDTDTKLPLADIQQEAVNQILAGGRHLLELISQILDLARIETGNISVSIKSVFLEDLCNYCVPLTESLASKRGIILNCINPDPTLAVLADNTRLRQVVLNLLSNAVKYNHEGGQVTLSASTTDHHTVIISIRDTGPGIPEEKQSQVFNAFDRLGAEASTTEGTGIGLTISKELVQLMNGTIGFESSPSQDTVFWIELPTASSLNGEDTTPLSKSVALDKAATESATKLATESVKKLLYFEDDPASIRLMERIVERFSGVELLSAHTAELGLELAMALSPDLIFMDISLPGIDGFKALELLKSDPATRKTRVVAVSANATASDIERGRQAGFADYISKPLEVDQILSHIETSLNGHIETSLNGKTT